MRHIYGYTIPLLLALGIYLLVFSPFSGLASLFVAVALMIAAVFIALKLESIALLASTVAGAIYALYIYIQTSSAVSGDLYYIAPLIRLFGIDLNILIVILALASIPLVRAALRLAGSHAIDRYIANDRLLARYVRVRSMGDLSKIFISMGLTLSVLASLYIALYILDPPRYGQYKALFYIHLSGSLISAVASWRLGYGSTAYGLGSYITLPLTISRAISRARIDQVLGAGRGPLLKIDNAYILDQYAKIPLPLYLSTKTSPHILVTGSTGMGKTTLCKLIARAAAKANIPVLILDFHGEYRDLEGFRVIRASEEVPQIIPSPNDPKESILELVDSIRSIFKLGTIQISVLTSILENYVRLGGGGFRDLLEFVEAHIDAKTGVRDPAYSLIPYLRILATHLGSRPLDLDKVISDYRWVIVDLGSLGSEYAAKIYVEYLVKNLWRWKVSAGHRDSVDLIVVIDEAHNVLKGSLGEFISRIIRESRKYGLSMIISTQQISDIPENILNNTGTFIVFRSIEAEAISRIVSSIQNARRGIRGTPPIDVSRLKPLEAYAVYMSIGGYAWKVKIDLKR